MKKKANDGNAGLDQGFLIHFWLQKQRLSKGGVRPTRSKQPRGQPRAPAFQGERGGGRAGTAPRKQQRTSRDRQRTTHAATAL